MNDRAIPRRMDAPMGGLDGAAGPVVLVGAASDWPAAKTWTPASLAARFGDAIVHPTMDLPRSGVPYCNTDTAHRRAVPLRELIARVEAHDRCYLDQADLAQFSGLLDELDLRPLTPPGRQFLSLWVGCGTRSGLHYDGTDNLLVQLHGVKRATLVSPDDAPFVYPFGDNVTKSRVDPDAPDLNTMPRFARATLHHAELTPGDVLFIPKGWWHHLAAPDASISVNCWYGEPLSFFEQVRLVQAAGASLWLSVARDFVWHGVLRRPYDRRLYCTPPTGKMLWDLVSGRAMST